MDRSLRREGFGTPSDCLRDAQLPAGRFKREPASCQHLPALFVSRQVGIAARNPMPYQPAVPEVLPPSFMRHEPARAAQRREENGSVRATEIERHVELLAAQGARDSPVLAPGAFGRVELQRPRAVHALRQPQDFRPDWRSQHVQRGLRILAFDLPQCGDQMKGVAQKTQVNDHDFTGRAGEVVKVGRLGRHRTREHLSQNQGIDDEKREQVRLVAGLHQDLDEPLVGQAS